MEEDEATTVRTLKAHCEVMTSLIQRYHGRVVDLPGDNLLADFSSVVDAVKCAAKIQEQLKSKNAELPENLRVEFRIGVHLGDVILDEERIYGEGVNIGARVVGLAEGGGICISSSVYEQVKFQIWHLYQGRYKAVLIDADNYLLELSRYVHLNPVRIKKHSGLEVKEKRKIIGSYRWSSYSGYSRQKDRQSFVDYSKILRMIGGRSERDARRHYSRFVISGIFKKMDMKVWEEVKGQAILGSEEFVDWVRERFLSKEKGNIREHPALKALKGGPRSVEEMIFFFMVKFLLSLIAAASLQTAHSLCHRLNLDG